MKANTIIGTSCLCAVCLVLGFTIAQSRRPARGASPSERGQKERTIPEQGNEARKEEQPTAPHPTSKWTLLAHYSPADIQRGPGPGRSGFDIDNPSPFTVACYHRQLPATVADNMQLYSGGQSDFQWFIDIVGPNPDPSDGHNWITIANPHGPGGDMDGTIPIIETGQISMSAGATDMMTIDFYTPSDPNIQPAEQPPAGTISEPDARSYADESDREGLVRDMAKIKDGIQP